MLKVSLQNTLGDALRQVRKSRQLTQQAVAKLGRVSIPTIRMLERGRGNLRTWAVVLDVLGVELVGRNLPAGEHIGWRVAALRKRRGLGQRGVAGSCMSIVRVIQIALKGGMISPSITYSGFHSDVGRMCIGSACPLRKTIG